VVIEACDLSTVRTLCEQFHGYASAGGVSVYCWSVVEGNNVVAAYAWQPPPPGAAVSVCSEAPAGVLSLSRMVAVPKDQRALVHVSKPLRVQMRRLIDRGRWPVLVTFSDEGQGHTGHVYKCSGWEKTTRKRVPVLTLSDGSRASRYSNGRTGGRDLVRAGWTWINRWEHWACERGQAARWMADHGWRRVPTGRKYRSGAPAFRWEQGTTTESAHG
jgi:hypothetical protein